MVSYSHLFQNFPQCIVIHADKGFGIINKAEVDVFLEFSYFFCDLTDVGNLISGSSAFSKSSLDIWKFTVHTHTQPPHTRFPSGSVIKNLPAMQEDSLGQKIPWRRA